LITSKWNGWNKLLAGLGGTALGQPFRALLVVNFPEFRVNFFPGFPGRGMIATGDAESWHGWIARHSRAIKMAFKITSDMFKASNKQKNVGNAVERRINEEDVSMLL